MQPFESFICDCRICDVNFKLLEVYHERKDLMEEILDGVISYLGVVDIERKVLDPFDVLEEADDAFISNFSLIGVQLKILKSFHCYERVLHKGFNSSICNLCDREAEIKVLDRPHVLE